MHYAVSPILHNALLRQTLTIALTPTISLILPLPLLTATLKSMYTACQLPTCPDITIHYWFINGLFTSYKAMVTKFMVSQACPPQIWQKPLFLSFNYVQRLQLCMCKWQILLESFCLSSILVICILMYQVF